MLKFPDVECSYSPENVFDVKSAPIITYKHTNTHTRTHKHTHARRHTHTHTSMEFVL